MRILNLFAGIGGNRRAYDGNWVTAVENDIIVADQYHHNFPEDYVVLDDVKNVLENRSKEINFPEYDFIWASPPCQSHSKVRIGYGYQIPDMTNLYGLIAYLSKVCSDKQIWVVENTIPWYEPLIQPTFTVGRHLFWSNVKIPSKNIKSNYIMKDLSYTNLKEAIGMDTSVLDASQYGYMRKRQILRNTVQEDIAKYVFRQMFKPKAKGLAKLLV